MTIDKVYAAMMSTPQGTRVLAPVFLKEEDCVKLMEKTVEESNAQGFNYKKIEHDKIKHYWSDLNKKFSLIIAPLEVK